MIKAIYEYQLLYFTLLYEFAEAAGGMDKITSGQSEYSRGSRNWKLLNRYNSTADRPILLNFRRL